MTVGHMNRDDAVRSAVRRRLARTFRARQDMAIAEFVLTMIVFIRVGVITLIRKAEATAVTEKWYAATPGSSEQRLRQLQTRLNDSEQRLPDRHAALTELTRNDLLARGDLQPVFARITEAAAKAMGVLRDSGERKQLKAQRREQDPMQRRVFVREIHHRVKTLRPPVMAVGTAAAPRPAGAVPCGQHAALVLSSGITAAVAAA